jgi:hypothetical protein
MSLNQSSNLLLTVIALAASAFAQQAVRIDLKATRSSVLVARSLQLNAVPYAQSGARVAAQLEYAVEPAGIATVSGEGLLRGISPGYVTVSVRDAVAGASAQLRLEVRPLRIELDPTQLEIRAGESARVAARAIDADGRVIAGLAFRYASAFAPVATVAPDGTVQGIAEGSTAVIASIAGTTSTGTGTVRVLRKSDYRIVRLQDSLVSTPSAITSVQEVTAAGTRVAYLATLAHGGQAAIVQENGRRRVLVTAGQYLPSVSRLVLRIVSLSINSRGDVAALIDHPNDVWCPNAIVVFRAAGTVDEAAAGCGIAMHPHALGENGNVTYQLNSGDSGVIREYAANGTTRVLFSMANLPAEMAGVTGLNWDSTSPSRYGHALALFTSPQGLQAWHYGGQRWQRVVRVGDVVDGVGVQWFGYRAFGNAEGKFYQRFGENGVLQMAPGQTKILTKNLDAYANGYAQRWSHNVVDAQGDRVLLCGDLSRDNKYGTYLSVISAGAVTPLGESNWNIQGGGFLADGRVAAVVIDQNELRPSLLDAGGASPLFPAGTTIDAPAAIDWAYPARGASSRVLVTRGAGESLVESGSGANRVLVSAGTRLPGSDRPLITLGGVATSANGTAAFVSTFPNGAGLYLYRGGQLSVLIDTVGAVKGPGGAALNNFEVYRQRRMAVNNRGEVVFMGNSGAVDRLLVIAPGESQARSIATRGAPLGGGILDSVDQVAIDEDGRVSFIGRVNGVQKLFFWDRARVEVIAQPGPATADRPPLVEFLALATNGREHVVLFNYNWNVYAFRSYDGARWLDLTSSTDARAGVLAIRRSFGPSQLTATCYLGEPLDGTIGAYCARSTGGIGLVARLGEKMPSGGTMLNPLGITFAENGEIYLSAQVYENGREFVALYRATPLSGQ